MITIRRSAERGHADHGWLDSRHTFSFAGYHDPAHMGFGPLRVINQDVVAPGRGFGAHPHQSMEILSYVISGALGHRDSTGAAGVIRPGEVQRMSAGSGVRHSEMNGSADEPVMFLQIWLLPSRAGGAPSYAQADFGRDPGLRLVVSPSGRDGSLSVGQDVDVWRWLDAPRAALPLRHRRAWIQVIRGQIDAHGALLGPGDAAALTDVDALDLRAEGDVEALLFDLPEHP
jgi:redox-sensitive bicupin YhaK (pirin superfamily)